MAWVVRHGCAGVKESWVGDDDARPLDDAGTSQSIEIERALAGAGVERIVTSPARRCRDTVLPLAIAKQLRIETASDLARDATGEAALAMVLQQAGDVVVCTHGEVMERIRSVLMSQGWSFVSDDDGEADAVLAKGVVWRLDPAAAQVHVMLGAALDCEAHRGVWWG